MIITLILAGVGIWIACQILYIGTMLGIGALNLLDENRENCQPKSNRSWSSERG